MPTASHACGVAVEVPATNAMAADLLEIIDLDAPDLPGNDTDIYEAVLDRMLGESEKSGVEASEPVAPVAATSAEAAEPANVEPVLDATAATDGNGHITRGWRLFTPAPVS